MKFLTESCTYVLQFTLFDIVEKMKSDELDTQSSEVRYAYPKLCKKCTNTALVLIVKMYLLKQNKRRYVQNQKKNCRNIN